ncbi:MAG TPA: hypothetical protein VF426_09155 [Marmoricola sp.]
MALDQAIDEFISTLEGPRRGADGRFDWTEWADTVRNQLRTLRDALQREAKDLRRRGDGWLDARDRTTDRTRRRLVQRLAAMGPRILERPEAETSLRELRRLGHDLEHYRQRVHDLVYDAVALELGGSE